MRDTPDNGPPEAPALPHNIEAEQALLGALLLNNEVIDRIRIDHDDFFDPVHARIYAKARQVIEKGGLASPVTMKPHLAADQGLAELGGTDYLARLAGATISIKSCPFYADSIVDLRRRRDALKAIEDAVSAISNIDGDLPETLATLLEALTDADGPSRSIITMRQALKVATERMNDAYTGKKLPGVDLGVPELTEKMGNALPGEVILLGGRPSMGKSALALEMAKRASKAGAGVAYWCGEMAPEDNAERAMSSEAKSQGTSVAYHAARRGRMNEDQFRALLLAGRDLESLPFVFIEPSIKRLDRILHETRRQVRYFQKQDRETLVVIDYLQMIDAPGKNGYESVSAASKAIKALAIELRTPILLLSQLSRAVESRDNKRPTLSDLRESGQIEQDANTVLFCYRDEYYLERLANTETDAEKASSMIALLEKQKGIMELIIAKQRSGPIETVEVGFQGSTNSITSLGGPRGDQNEGVAF